MPSTSCACALHRNMYCNAAVSSGSPINRFAHKRQINKITKLKLRKFTSLSFIILLVCCFFVVLFSFSLSVTLCLSHCHYIRTAKCEVRLQPMWQCVFKLNMEWISYSQSIGFSNVHAMHTKVQTKKCFLFSYSYA